MILQRISSLDIAPNRNNLFWVLLLCLLGIAIALIPFQSAVIILGLIVLLVIAVISPLAMLIMVLILSPLRTLIATEGQWPLPIDIGQLLFLIYLLRYSMNFVLRSQLKIKLKTSPLLYLLILFVLVLIPSAFIASSLSLWLSEWLKWFIIALLSWIILQDNAQHWQWLIFGLVLAAVSNAVVGLYIFLGGSGADHLLINGRFFRAFGTFGQPNPFGGFMGLIGPLALMMVYGYAHATWQTYQHHKTIDWSKTVPLFFYLVSSLIIIAALFASWSRGAWLGFIVSIVVMMLVIPRQWQHSLIALILSVTLIAGLWFSGLLPQSVVARINSSTEEFFAFEDVRGVDITPDNYAVVERLAHWQAAFNMFEAAPWIGIGFGNYEAAYKEYRLLNWREALGHAHNYYLNILAEAGIIGLLSYLLIFAGILTVTWLSRQHPNRMVHAVCVGLLGSWFYLLFHSLLDNLYVNNTFLHLAVMLGILMIMFNKTHDHVRWSYHDAS